MGAPVLFRQIKLFCDTHLRENSHHGLVYFFRRSSRINDSHWRMVVCKPAESSSHSLVVRKITDIKMSLYPICVLQGTFTSYFGRKIEYDVEVGPTPSSAMTKDHSSHESERAEKLFTLFPVKLKSKCRRITAVGEHMLPR